MIRSSGLATVEIQLWKFVCFLIRVDYHVGCIDNKFNIDQVDFEDNLCEHINRDRISIMIAHVLNKRFLINERDEKYEYDVHVRNELAGCYGHD